MDTNDLRQLRTDAQRCLEKAPDHKRLVLISSGVTVGVTLLVALLDFLLEGGIAQTGGLGGMELRSLLETAQSLLSLALNLLLPFWAAGYTAATLGIAKGEAVGPRTLLTGLRRFGPLLRLQILTGLITFFVTFLCIQLSSLVLSFTPLAVPLYETMLPLMEQGSFDPAAVDAATSQAILEAGLPMLVCMGALLLAVLIPVSYFLRLATVRLLDAPEQGARAAVAISIRLMRGNCMKLFRLDLGFWWFYLAQLLVLLLSWADALLPAMGIALPFSGNVSFFVFYALGLAAQLALFFFCRNRVEVTYARFYLALLPKDADQPNDQNRRGDQ